MTGWVRRIKIWYLFWSILECDNIFVLCRITDLSFLRKVLELGKASNNISSPVLHRTNIAKDIYLA